MDWFANGGPREGREASRPCAGETARRDVPTCAATDRRGDVARRVRDAGWPLAVVLDGERVVLGLLDALDGDPAAAVEDVMRAAPTTIRPHVTLEKAAQSLKTRRHDRVLVTTSDGRLIGLLWRADAERRLAQSTAPAQTASR